MRYQKPMRLLAAAGLLALLFCVTGLFSVASARVPGEPEGADHDGYADLAIGIPGMMVGPDDGAGALGVLYGNVYGLSDGGAQYFDQESSGIGGGAEPLDHFARALASGDFNRDGYIDLAVGVPDEMVGTTSGAGYVQVLYSGPGGLTGAGSDSFDETSFGLTVGTNEHWGAALASGDFNCDGYDDLAIGAPGEDYGTVESAGMVNILYGGSTSFVIIGSGVFTQGSPLLETPEEGDNFGKTLAAGDFDGDGCHDLAIGAPNEALQIGPALYANAGVVLVAYGSLGGITGTGSDLWYQGNYIQDAVEDNDFFGDALAAGDFNGDGKDDLAIGVPKEDYPGSDAGIIQLLWGSFSGLTADVNQRYDQSMCGSYTIEAYDKFGFALAAGDFDGNGRDDLVIGAPGQSVTALEDAGMVCVLFGPNLPTVSWTWANPYPAEGDYFGAALAVGDFDNNQYADLAVGAPQNDGPVTDAGAVYVRNRTSSAWQAAATWSLGDIGISLTANPDDEFGTALAALDEPNTHMAFLNLPVVLK